MADSQVVIGAESPAVDHQPWKTEVYRLGPQGVNLTASLDALTPQELARLTNGVTRLAGGIQTRPGLTQLAYAPGTFHSACRLNDPNDGASTLFWGVDQTLQRGLSGALNNIGSGFSGQPLSFVSWESEYSGEPWMYVADASRMAKASRTSPMLAIGLPKAGQPSSITAAAPLVTDIATFTSADGTDAGAWTGITGADAMGNGSATPILYDAAPPSVNMAIGAGTASGSYYSGMSIAKALNLAVLPGSVVSTDEDQIHFELRVNVPDKISEVRIYFALGAFTNGVVPGLEQGTNTDAYVRAFRSSDFAQFITQTQDAQAAAAVHRAARVTASSRSQEEHAAVRRNLDRRFAEHQRQQDALAETEAKLARARAAISPLTEGAANLISSETLAGSDVWTAYGAIDLPLRKADFLKIGNAGQPGLTWADISGIVITVITNSAADATLGFDNCYLTGGYGPDTSEPDAQAYDYRVVNVDSRTGARSNPSDVRYLADGKTVNGIDALRQAIVVQPQAYGDGAVFQEIYRRGGSLNDNWYGPVGKNSNDGAPVTDTVSDIEALTTGEVQIDHDQPVTTTDDAGNAVYGQPLTFLLGPIDGYLFGGGDAHRPGDLYWCKRGEPDHWPAFNHQQVCPPSETLMNGGLYGGQGFVFSRERMYAAQVGIGDNAISTNPTDCAQGLIGRNAMAIGPGGIYFCSRDAVRVTQGGLSQPISDKIRALFRPNTPGEAVNGYYPIDFSQPDQIRLQVNGDDLWFGFLDTQGSRIWWVFSLVYQTWRCAIFGQPTAMVYSDPGVASGVRLIVGGDGTGMAWTHAGNGDDGVLITVTGRTGALWAGMREEKLLGDITVWGALGPAANLTLQAFLNSDTVVDAVDLTGAESGFRQYISSPFGTQPQHATSVGLGFSWVGEGVGIVTQFGIATAIQPEVTMLRATQWQPLNQAGEAYLYGCWIDCDTFGENVEVSVEGLLGGNLVGVSIVTINSTHGRRLWFDWFPVHVDLIRIRPTTPCAPWMLFGQGWLTRPEPPRLPGMDSGLENLGDTYYTGLDLEIDTFAQAKQVVIVVDGMVLSDPATSNPWWTFIANGRSLIHLTLPWGRGHIYRFYATDTVPVLLYSHKWLVETEPGEQTNWNQNFTIAGSHTDKWLKGILLECDTFGLIKQVNVDIDGVPHPDGPFPVVADGRKVVQVAFPQALGRVFRIFPIDAHPGRLYSSGWLFDEEPYQLTRFETQEIRLGIDDWKVATYGQITYKASESVNFRCLVYGQDGQLLGDDTYVLPATTGKAMTPHKPLARKGVLYKYLITSAAGFWLYREESWIQFQPWQGGAAMKLKPFGNDDLDATRGMTDAMGAAARAGGSLGTGLRSA